MRYNTTLELQKEGIVGMTPQNRPIRGWVTVHTFDAFILPLKRENVLREFGIFIDKPFRVITKEKYNYREGTHFFDGNKRYIITEALDLKYNIFLVEEVLE